MRYSIKTPIFVLIFSVCVGFCMTVLNSCSMLYFYHICERGGAKDTTYTLLDNKLTVNIRAMYSGGWYSSIVRFRISNNSNSIIQFIPSRVQIHSKLYDYEFTGLGPEEYNGVDTLYIKKDDDVELRMSWHRFIPVSYEELGEVFSLDEFGLYKDDVPLITQKLEFVRE